MLKAKRENQLVLDKKFRFHKTTNYAVKKSTQGC